MLWPVPGYHTVTSGYADTRSYGLHGGFDIAAPAVPCVAIGNGIVIYTGWAGSAGRSVYVELEGGYRVHYCHLSRIAVGAGQHPATGDVIGLVGGSGHNRDNYYGSHLHLNLFAAERPSGPSHYVSWVGMWAVDPELYLKEDDEMPSQAEWDAFKAWQREAATIVRSKDIAGTPAYVIKGKVHHFIPPHVWEASGRDDAVIVEVPNYTIIQRAPIRGPDATVDDLWL